MCYDNVNCEVIHTFQICLMYHEFLSFLQCVKVRYLFLSGIFKSTKIPPLYIDVSQVTEFCSVTDNGDSIEFGASVTLSCLADFLTQNSNQSVTFEADFLTQNSNQSVTFESIASHLLKVAGKPVRNVSS